MVQQNPPGALRKPKPSGVEILELGEYLASYREAFALTQVQAASVLKVPYRRLQAFEATNRWNAGNKDKIRQLPEVFGFTEVMTLAKQGWASQRSLGAAIERIIKGEKPRKRYVKSGAISDSPYIDNLVDCLRSKYGTKVTIDEQVIVFSHFGNQALFEALAEKLTR